MAVATQLSDELRQEIDEFVKSFGRERLLFYDIEVYKEDSFVIFYTIDKEEVAVYHNRSGFGGLFDLVKTSLLVGYNNYFYDDIILSIMLSQPHDVYDNARIKRINDVIIATGNSGIQLNKSIKSLDCFQQIHVSRPSLKKVEANKGVSIEETSVGFDIDRALTEEELEQEMDYCRYDISQTVDIFLDRFDSYFKPKLHVLNMIEDPKPYILESGYRWNTTTISANVVKGEARRAIRTAYLQVPDEVLSWAPDDVVEMWKTKEKGKITKTAFNNDVVFGFGGLHSTHNHYREFKNLMLADFRSLYPHIITTHRLLGKYTDRFEEILNQRLEIRMKVIEMKKRDDLTDDEKVELKRLDDEQEALKLVINSVYGLLKNKYSTLYDPMISTSVCAIGQCYLFELANRLSSSCIISQCNTDGIFFIPQDDRWKEICKEFEREVNIPLDYEHFKSLHQKDVNNYIALSDNGWLELKGADTNGYLKPRIYQTESARICQIALVDYLVYDKPVLDTLVENRDNPVLYQYVLQAGNTYIGTADEDGNMYQKVNRVFATHYGKGVTLGKKKGDGSLVNYPNAPENMFVWNRDVDEIEDFKNIIDLGHYLKITNRMIDLWEGN